MPKSGEHRVNQIDSFFRVRPSSQNIREGENVSFLEDGKLIKQEKRNGIVYEQVYVEQGKTQGAARIGTSTGDVTNVVISGSSSGGGDITGITAGTGLTGGGASGNITLDIDSTVTTLTGTQTLTNKTLTSPVINTGVSGTAILDEDTMSSDSDTKLATQQSIKAYVDTEIAAVPSPADATITLSPGAGIAAIGNFTTNQSSNETLTIGVDGVLEDLDAMTAVTSANQFIVSTAAGTYHHENATNARLSLGLGDLALLDEISDADVGSDANISVTKLSANTISGVTLGNNLNALTLGSGLNFDAGSSYTGATARQISVGSLALSNFNADVIIIDSEVGSVTRNDSRILTSSATESVIESYGYTTNTGTVTSVAVAGGNGLTSSGGPITSSGTITLAVGSDTLSVGADKVDLSASALTAVSDVVGSDGFIFFDASATPANSPRLGTVSDLPFTNNAGTITSVTGGAGLTGSASSGGVTLAVGAGTGITVNGDNVALSTAGAGAGTYGDTANSVKIDTITLDAYGRVTAVATGGTGDISSVVAGTGLSGGSTSGDATLDLDINSLGSSPAVVRNGSEEIAVWDPDYNTSSGQTAKITLDDVSDYVQAINFTGTTNGVMTRNANGTLTAESGLTFSGTFLHISKDVETTGTTGTTLLKLTNDVGTDLSQQKTFVDFTFLDDNSNETPQVRIGAEVGQNADANSLEKEGSGAFVVYTNNADTGSGDAGASLAERMRVDYQGNVGIGTTSPSDKLEIAAPNSQLRLTDSDDGQYIQMSLSSDALLFRHNTTSGTAAVAFKDDGNVGIGTNSPGRDLEVAGNGIIRLNNASSDTGIDFNSSDMQIRYRGASDLLQIYSYGTSSNIVTIKKSDGNVGIGETNPDSPLHIGNNVATSAGFDSFADYQILLYDTGTSTTSYGMGIRANTFMFNSDVDFEWRSDNSAKMFLDGANGRLGIGTSSPAFSYGTRGIEIEASGQNPALRLDRSDNAYEITTRGADTLVYSMTNLPVRFGQNGSERFRLTATEVVINEDGASRDFRVEGDTNTNLLFVDGSADRVGIGTNSPDQLLDLQADPPVLQLTNSRDGAWTSGDEIAQINFHSNDLSGIGGHSVGFIKMVTGTGSTSLGGEMTFGTGDYNTAATERMRIDEDGNVGIGTGSPSNGLELYGAARNIFVTNTTEDAAGIIMQDAQDPGQNGRIVYDSGANKLYLQTHGGTGFTMDSLRKIGIGTTSPAEKLDVNGNIRIGGGGGLFVEHSTASLGGTVIHPNGGTYRTSTSPLTGAIKITLPTGTGTIADMISFWVDIFDYSTDESLTCYIAGYAYQTAGSNEWVNEEALMLSANQNRDFIVRFGHDGSNHCVYIGELTSSWGYPQITIRNVQIGFSSDVDTYNDGWSISFESSAFQNVDHTQTDNFPYAKGLKSSSNMGAYIDGNEKFRFTTGGAFHASNDVVAYSTTPSDKKLKTNVKDIEYGLDTIMKLKPKQYDWKKDNRKDIGFIAQEVEEVIPEIVKDNEWFDDKIKTMDYEKLTAVLIKAVQEQQKQIEELKNG